MALSDIRRQEWQRSRAHAYWVALLGKHKLPTFERWVDPDQGFQKKPGGRRVHQQNLDQMKNAIFQHASRTGTQVTQGDRVLIAAKPIEPAAP